MAQVRSTCATVCTVGRPALANQFSPHCGENLPGREYGISDWNKGSGASADCKMDIFEGLTCSGRLTRLRSF